LIIFTIGLYATPDALGITEVVVTTENGESQNEFREGDILQIKGSGAAVSHSIKIDIIKPNGESLTDEPFYMVTTSDGSFSLTWQVPTDIESGDYTINATDGNNEASTTMKLLITAVQETVPKTTISISTDEESYQVGDTILVTGNVGNYISGDWVTTEFIAPNGNIAQVEKITPNSYGDFSTSFKISLKTNGVYKIKALFGSAETSTSFLVGSAERALIPLASLNEKMEITMDFANESNDSQPFAFIVQIKDENNLVISMSNIIGILGVGQTLDQVLSYMPTEPGTYTIEKFLWSNLNNPTALIDEKETFTFIAADVGITISDP